MQLPYLLLLVFCLLASVSPVLSLSLPSTGGSPTLQRRTTPYFPSDPPSCPICEQNYASINSCAQACPVLANITNVCGKNRKRSASQLEWRWIIRLMGTGLSRSYPTRVLASMSSSALAPTLSSLLSPSVSTGEYLSIRACLEPQTADNHRSF